MDKLNRTTAVTAHSKATSRSSEKSKSTLTLHTLEVTLLAVVQLVLSISTMRRKTSKEMLMN